MFSVYCTAVRAEVLLDSSSIVELVNGGSGSLAIEYRCSCGERGLWQNGRGAPYAVEACAS
jgi:hypothetical protein